VPDTEISSIPGRHFKASAHAGQRLDAALALLAGVSRAESQRWISGGYVRLNAHPCRASQRLREGDEIEATPPAAEPLELVPEPIPLTVLYEDEDLLVIDKPAGLVVHPAPGHARGTLVNALLHHCTDLAGIGGVLRPGIVHRLDRGTSGALVVAKHDAAHHALSAQFRVHAIERVYWAIARGLPRGESGFSDRALGRHPRDRKRMSVRTRTGRQAHTTWRVLRRYPSSRCVWLEVSPTTGRTHQIRVHLAAAGLPLLGDSVYGRERGHALAFGRPALHAVTLGFRHPRSGEWLRFTAPLSGDLEALILRLDQQEGRA